MTFHALERPVHGGSLASRTAVSFGNGSRTVRDGRPSRRAQRTEEVGSGGGRLYGFGSRHSMRIQFPNRCKCKVDGAPYMSYNK